MDDETARTDRQLGGDAEGRSPLGLAAVTVLFLACTVAGDGSSSSDPTGPDANDTAPAVDTLPPVNLALPVPAAALLEGAIVNPFGVVRSSLDLGVLGHSGIDLVSAQGTAIHTVGDGTSASASCHLSSGNVRSKSPTSSPPPITAPAIVAPPTDKDSRLSRVGSVNSDVFCSHPYEPSGSEDELSNPPHPSHHPHHPTSPDPPSVV